MDLAPAFAFSNRYLNRLTVPLVKSRRWSALVGRSLTIISYTGRRSGHTFSTTVMYRRSGDHVTIRVAMPESKQWWRNFLDGGGPISLWLDGTDRIGNAVASRDDKGRVEVQVQLSDPHRVA